MNQEADLYRWIRENLGRDMDVVRIENVAGNGVPDLNICHMGFEAWVECKFSRMTQVMLRPEQYAWSMRRANHGGSCFVLNYDPTYKDSLQIWTFPGFQVRPSGKYVRIVSEMHHEINQDAKQLRKVLFPAL